MDFLLSVLTAISMLAAFALAWRARRQRSGLWVAMRERDHAVIAEQAAIRTLRLAAIELRAPAMILLGHADSLVQPGTVMTEESLARHRAAVAGLAMQVLNLADELQDHAAGLPASRVLRLEFVSLEPMLRDAIVAVDVLLGPSRRNWRLAPDLSDIRLQVDRRALAQVLARVLGNAARLSRDQDWIDIRTAPTEDDLGIVVEDEGAGLPACNDLSVNAPARFASRGVGLGLTLARSLMEAHGGALTIESISQVGSRVVLRFPVTCLVAAPGSAGSTLP